MKYYYNHFVHLLIVIGSLIVLEILAAKHVNQGFSTTGPPAVEQSAIPSTGSMNGSSTTALGAGSASSGVTGVQTDDAKVEDWENTKFNIRIIL